MDDMDQLEIVVLNIWQLFLPTLWEVYPIIILSYILDYHSNMIYEKSNR